VSLQPGNCTCASTPGPAASFGLLQRGPAPTITTAARRDALGMALGDRPPRVISGPFLPRSVPTARTGALPPPGSAPAEAIGDPAPELDLIRHGRVAWPLRSQPAPGARQIGCDFTTTGACKELQQTPVSVRASGPLQVSGLKDGIRPTRKWTISGSPVAGTSFHDPHRPWQAEFGQHPHRDARGGKMADATCAGIQSCQRWQPSPIQHFSGQDRPMDISQPQPAPTHQGPAQINRSRRWWRRARARRLGRMNVSRGGRLGANTTLEQDR